MKSDYRNTKLCQGLIDIKEKKRELKEKIKSEHPKVRNDYNKISDKKGPYYQEFSNIYNNRCAYCGVLVKLTGNVLFEIDHYICESKFESKAIAGDVNNLVFSCYTCNRGKKDYLIKDNYVSLLNPDDNSIAKVYDRDEMYYIRIKHEYINDTTISIFYEKLKLGFQIRRIEYLLLEMEQFKKKLSGDNLTRLQAAIGLLLEKRNTFKDL